MSLDPELSAALSRIDNRSVEMLALGNAMRGEMRELRAAWLEHGAALNLLRKDHQKLARKVSKLAGDVDEVEEITGRHQIAALEKALAEKTAQAERADERMTWWTRWGADSIRMFIAAIVSSVVAYFIGRTR